MPTPVTPIGQPSPDSSITSGRQTRAVFDVPDYVLTEDGVAVVRMYQEVAPFAARDKSLNSRFHANMKQWASGAWTLAPLQEGDFQEKKTPQPFVYVQTDTTSFLDLFTETVASITYYNAWKQNSGQGLIFGPTIDNHTDGFFQRKITSTQGWNQGLLTAPTPFSDVASVLPTLTQPLGTIARQVNMARADQGFCLRFSSPGTQANHPDVIGTFHFGGGMGGTLPQYMLILNGSGLADLCEYGRVSETLPYTWGRRHQFRYCNPAQVALRWVFSR